MTKTLALKKRLVEAEAGFVWTWMEVGENHKSHHFSSLDLVASDVSCCCIVLFPLAAQVLLNVGFCSCKGSFIRPNLKYCNRTEDGS